MSHYSPSYSITMRLRYPDEPGRLGRITSAIGVADGLIGAVDIVSVERDWITRDITVSATSVEHGDRIIDGVRAVDGVEVVHVSDRTSEHTNHDSVGGDLSEVIVGADVFIGVSGPNVLEPAAVQRMARDPIVFALANPDPEIDPEVAQPYVRVMATGRSDYPNQINNVLCFPGFFRGLLDVCASRVMPEMKVAAAQAIADVISEHELRPDYIIPSVFDRRVAQAVTSAVSQAAIDTGVARRQLKPSVSIARRSDAVTKRGPPLERDHSPFSPRWWRSFGGGAKERAQYDKLQVQIANSPPACAAVQ